MDWKEKMALRRIGAVTHKEVFMLAKFNLPTGEWVSVVKGAVVAAAGAALTYLSANLSGMDFGTYTPVVVAVLSIFVNMFRKVIENPAEPEKK